MRASANFESAWMCSTRTWSTSTGRIGERIRFLKRRKRCLTCCWSSLIIRNTTSPIRTSKESSGMRLRRDRTRRWQQASGPWRKHYEITPFGSGRRVCLGMTFAAISMHLQVASLLHAFDWELPGGLAPEKLDMTEGQGILLSMRCPLVAIAKPRLPSHLY